MRLAAKLLIGFLVVVIPVICIESVSILELNQIAKPVNDLHASQNELHKAANLNELALRMQYYDELLTQSARNYAFTEDVKWKDRYKAAEPELDGIIKRSVELGDDNDREFFMSVDEANLALVKMEYASLDLVNQGNSDEAIKMLESKQYWDLKKIYAQGLAHYAMRHDEAEANAIGVHNQSIESLIAKIQSVTNITTVILAISIPIILVSSALFVFMISRRISKPFNLLVESVKKVASGEFGIQIKITGNDEIYALAESFNLMSTQLKGYTRKIEIDKAKDEFMAMMSHELKTPLVPISGYVGLLLANKYGELTSMQRERILIIQSSVNSLLKLMSDLLDAQKMDLGQLKLNVKNEDLGGLILETIEKMKPVADRSGIVITTDLQDNLHCKCDRNRMGQVISNILINSLDFCHKNSGKIHFAAKFQGGFVSMVVKDNGVGITREKMSRMFTKFYQGDASMTREHGGTGLGLAVCKGIVDSHGGKIWVESEGVDKGTAICIVLPHDNIVRLNLPLS